MGWDCVGQAKIPGFPRCSRRPGRGQRYHLEGSTVKRRPSPTTSAAIDRAADTESSIQFVIRPRRYALCRNYTYAEDQAPAQTISREYELFGKPGRVLFHLRAKGLARAVATAGPYKGWGKAG